MKRGSKLIHLTAASAVMFLALAGQGFAASNPIFTDLANVAAKDKIIALQQSGVIAGVTPTLFAPHESLIQAQGIQLIVRALGLNLDTIRFVKEPKATDYFTNADDNAWYANAFIIAAVHSLDLSKDLDPSQQLTREQFTYQLIHAIESIGRLPLINPVVTDVKDADQMTIEYSGAIQRALTYGVVTLNAEGKFNPKAAITREQAAEEIYNAIQYLNAHPAPSAVSEAITASEGVKLIADTLGLAGTDIKIKIDPNAIMTRESFVSLFVQILQSSEKLPMLKIVPLQIKDMDQIDNSNTGAIQLAVTLGFVKLSDDGTFNPKRTLSRSDAAAIAGSITDYLNAHPTPSASN